MSNVPNLTYNYFSYNKMSDTAPPTAIKQELNCLPEDPISMSFQTDYNQIKIIFSTDTELSYYEVRVTGINDEYGIGKGQRWYYSTNIAGGSSHTFTMTANSTYFPIPEGATEPDGLYRVGLYGKSAATGYWDVTYLLISSDDYIVAPSDYDGIEVLTDEAIPSA